MIIIVKYTNCTVEHSLQDICLSNHFQINVLPNDVRNNYSSMKQTYYCSPQKVYRTTCQLFVHVYTNILHGQTGNSELEIHCKHY